MIMIKILQFIGACLFVFGGALFGAYLLKDAAGAIAGGIAGFPIALLFLHLTDKSKVLICIIRGYWRSLRNWPDYKVSGHDYVEIHTSMALFYCKCETCGHELKTYR